MSTGGFKERGEGFAKVGPGGRGRRGTETDGMRGSKKCDEESIEETHARKVLADDKEKCSAPSQKKTRLEEKKRKSAVADGSKQREER